LRPRDGRDPARVAQAISAEVFQRVGSQNLSLELPLFAVIPSEVDTGKESRCCSGLEGVEASRVKESFLDEIRTFHVVPEFRNAADLQRQVKDRMNAIAAEDLAPWCKLETIVFRASEIEGRGNSIRVIARVRDDAVARALENARGDQWNRGTLAQFTWSGRSKFVKVTEARVTTTPARSKMFRLQLEVNQASQDSFLEVTHRLPFLENLNRATLC
jgi:hypothetical protein